MSDHKIERLLEKIREKLRTDRIPDDFTGSVTLNIQQGGLAPKIEVNTQV